MLIHMTRVLVLGAQGMLGSMVATLLNARPGLEVIVTTRREQPRYLTGIPWRRFDARRDSLRRLLERDRCDWVVNGIALTAPRIDIGDDRSVRWAIEVNSLFPRQLAAVAGRVGQRVIQIATDGVYSGSAGPYDESASHDPIDVYGMTKSLGETVAANVVRLRCSIVGPEHGPPSSLLGWVLSQPAGTRVRGFTGQQWNGVTSLHFARFCAAIVGGHESLALQHIVPSDTVTKAQLIELISGAFGRADLDVLPEPGPHQRNRTLATLHPSAHLGLWRATGYMQPPTIAEMLAELAAETRASQRAG
jgi:dTDP-4-dehydrorhamnose reductase